MPNVSKAAAMRALLRDHEVVISPGAYDGYSGRLIEAMGFKAEYLSLGAARSMLSALSSADFMAGARAAR